MVDVTSTKALAIAGGWPQSRGKHNGARDQLLLAWHKDITSPEATIYIQVTDFYFLQSIK